ncbi:hypothetical protein ACQUEO_14455, partial [Lactococcus lactis]
SSFLLLSFSIILPYLIVDLKLCNRTLQKAIDEIRETFDFLSIQKASSLSEGSRVIYRNKLIGGHAASQNKEDKNVS